MNAKKLDPRGQTGKRTPTAIHRFLSGVGLLPRVAARSVNRHDPGKPCERIPVWDARLGAFRDVDPENRHDPLREPARQLASLRTTLSRDDPESSAARTTNTDPVPATAVDRQRNDPPRSPTGGGNRVALDGAE